MAVEVVGSANVDIVARLDRLPGAGETVLAWGQARHAGGKGANQAAAAARMGAQTRLAAAIGGDGDGEWLARAIAATGVDIGALAIKPDTPTGAAHIAVDAAGENLIVVLPGANGAFTEADLPPPDPAVRVVLAQGEVPVATVIAAFARSEALRLFNPAPASAALLEAFALADIVIVNEHELLAFGAFAGLPAFADELTGARALLEAPDIAPRQAVIVTLGARGALHVTREGSRSIPAVPVTPIDTTGAGDCFCGSLAALLDLGDAMAEALALASAAAALSTLSPGALAAMPSRAEVDEFLRTLRRSPE